MTKKKQDTNVPKKSIVRLGEKIGFNAREMTYAQMWYIRSEIQNIFNKKLAFKIAKDIENELWKVNDKFANPLSYELDKKMKPDYSPMDKERTLRCFINDTYQSLKQFNNSQEMAIFNCLEQYLTFKVASEETNKLMKVLSDWNIDFVVSSIPYMADHFEVNLEDDNKEE